MNSIKYITSSPQNGQTLINCQKPGKTKETWKLRTMWYPGWDPGTEKKDLGTGKVHRGKTGKVCSSIYQTNSKRIWRLF